jgi:hypothetical protein
MYSVIAVLALASAVSGQDDNRGAKNEFAPGFGLGIELTKRVRLDFIVSKDKSEELQSSKQRFVAGISFRTKPLLKRFLDDYDADKAHVLVVTPWYEYSHSSEPGISTNEHKLTLEASIRYAFTKRTLATDRNRHEFRFINGVYHYRYRNQLIVEHRVRVKKFKFSPYVAPEAIWDKTAGSWSHFKFVGGAFIPFFGRSVIDTYYERRHCNICADTKTNVFGLKLYYFIRLH